MLDETSASNLLSNYLMCMIYSLFSITANVFSDIDIVELRVMVIC